MRADEEFYPGDKKELTNQLQQPFEKAHPNEDESSQLQAIISPHAGYIFSGEVAASAFNQIPENASYKPLYFRR